MMWIGSGFFIMVLAIAEWYLLFPGLDLPVPIFIAAGLLLAVMSNRGKHINLPWRSPHAPPLQASKSPKAKPVTQQPTPTTVKVIPDPTPVQTPRRSPELPKLNLPTSSEKPVSFKIRKPD